MNAPLAKEQIALLMSDSLTYRMPLVEGTDGIIAEPRPDLFEVLFAKVRSMFTAIAELPRRRAVLDELRMLSDRELADIGLTRNELGRVFEPGFAPARNA